MAIMAQNPVTSDNAAKFRQYDPDGGLPLSGR